MGETHPSQYSKYASLICCEPEPALSCTAIVCCMHTCLMQLPAAQAAWHGSPSAIILSSAELISPPLPSHLLHR